MMWLAWLVTILTIGCTSSSAPRGPAAPLVDGHCDEYELLNAERFTVSDEVELMIYQDRDYVWFCYTYPEGSYGTMDMVLITDTLPEPLNLHVSGQIGEWPANRPDLAPSGTQRDRWWNAEGWIANPPWFNGMDESVDPPQYRFDNDPARELQLAKSRFGSGVWQFKLEIRAITRPDGSSAIRHFPADTEQFHHLHVR